MKTSVSFLIVSFGIGLFAGAGVLRLFSGTTAGPRQDPALNALPAPFEETTRVGLAEARSVYKAYLSQPVSIKDIRGFSVSKAQYDAMGLILKTHPGITGFTIHYGIRQDAPEEPSGPVWIVAGKGEGDLTDAIYLTGAAGAGPCPNVCDDDSPITRPGE